MSFENIEKQLAGFLLRSARAAGKKQLRSTVRSLKSQIRKGKSRTGGPPSKRTGTYRRSIAIRHKFKGSARRGADLLHGGPQAFLAVRSWTPRAKYLRNSASRRYRTLNWDASAPDAGVMSSAIAESAYKGMLGFLRREMKKRTLIKIPPGQYPPALR